jgi:hypothetical protein
MLSMAREAFVDALSAVPRKSAAMEAILVFNRGSQEAAV